MSDKAKQALVAEYIKEFTRVYGCAAPDVHYSRQYFYVPLRPLGRKIPHPKDAFEDFIISLSQMEISTISLEDFDEDEDESGQYHRHKIANRLYELRRDGVPVAHIKRLDMKGAARWELTPLDGTPIRKSSKRRNLTIFPTLYEANKAYEESFIIANLTENEKAFMKALANNHTSYEVDSINSSQIDDSRTPCGLTQSSLVEAIYSLDNKHFIMRGEEWKGHYHILITKKGAQYVEDEGLIQ